MKPIISLFVALGCISGVVQSYSTCITYNPFTTVPESSVINRGCQIVNGADNCLKVTSPNFFVGKKSGSNVVCGFYLSDVETQKCTGPNSKKTTCQSMLDTALRMFNNGCPSANDLIYEPLIVFNCPIPDLCTPPPPISTGNPFISA